MSNQILISSGAKLRDLDDVIIGTDGVLSSLAFNVANGVPKLDENGKILVSQLPNSVMEFKGVWNAATNTPTLADGTGNAGDVYLCNVAGTVNFGSGPIAFAVGDYAVYTGTVWARSSGATGTVTSVGVSRDGNALAITGSPITTSGTINLGFSGNSTQYINGAGNLTTFPTLITSIGLTMPAAFNVSNSPLTANGTIGVTAAGYPSQYIRGDGTLADFPTSGGGGSSVSYYFNGGTSQGTIGGTTYYEMSKTANTGAGVDFSKSGDGLITAFLTDAGDPALLQIPAGNWNYEVYASMSSNGGTPELYAELYVYNGTTFTLISTSTNEILYDGINLNLYTFAMAVPETTLTVTDRLAVKLYSTNSGGKTTTVHTQNGHLCQVITTFTTGLTALNGLTAQVQYFGTGTSGSDFNIVSSVDTHTFNLPTASATKRGALSSADWSTFNGKQDFITAGTTLQYFRGDKTFQTLNTSVVPELTNLYFTDARARAAISLTTTGSSGSSTYSNITGILNVPTYTLAGLGGVPSTRNITINGLTQDLSADRTWTITAGVSSVTASSPLFSSGGSTPNITIQQSTALQSGFLSSADWVTFNNKLGVGFDTYGTLYARTAVTTYRDHSISAANDAPIKSLAGTEDNWIYLDAANAQWGIYHRNIDTDLVVAGQPTLPANSIAFIGANQIASYVSLANGNGFFRGTINASNFSGSSSGTNTGDQDLSGYLTTATAASTYLPLVGGTLTGRLTINVTNNYGVLMNRPAVTNYIGLLYSTANTSQWFVGMRENSTNNYIVYNEVLGTDAFTISRTNNSVIFSGAYGTNYGVLVSGATYGIVGVNRGQIASSAGMNYYTALTQKWFTGIYENTDNFGFYSILTNSFPLIITPNGLVTFTRNESSYGMVRLKGSAVEASIGYGFATDTDVTTWVVGKGAGLGDTTFGWYYGGVKMILTTGGSLLVNTGTGVTGGGALQVNGNVNINGVFQINGVTIGGGGGSGVTGSGGTNYITKWTGSSTLGNSVLYESSNNIGIGTTSTAERLVVNGNIISYAVNAAWAEGLSVIVPTVSTWGGIRFRRERSGYDGNWGVGYVGFDSTDDLVFISNNGGAQINNILRLTKGGNVLINTGTDNGYKLQLNGSASFAYGFLSVYRGSSSPNDILVGNSGSVFYIGGNTQVVGSVSASGGFFDTSDARLKTLVEDNYLLSSIANVKAKLYKKDGRMELGYYAQDLEAILPSAVKEGSDGFLSLSYAQVHTAKIAVIEDEVTILKNRVSELEKQLNLN